MSSYVLSCCSSIDISKELVDRLGISYLSFHFIIDDKDYKDDLGQTFTSEQLYDFMTSGSDVRSSQPSVGEYIDYFTPFLKEGKDVLHLVFSSGLSGAYNAAVTASEILSAEYPERKLYIVDSLAASSGYGMFMERLAEIRDEGKSIDELRDIALELRHKVNHLFFTTDLTYFVKGGRISKASGLIGSILSICPILCIDPDGKIVSMTKAKGKKQAISKIVTEMELRAENGNAYSGKCFIGHSRCLGDAEKVAALIEERIPALKDQIKIFPIGTTIGCHTGPGTVALFFFSTEDRSI